MVWMSVADDNCVKVVHADKSQQVGQNAGAAIQKEAAAFGFDQIARTGAVGRRVWAPASQDCQSHGCRPDRVLERLVAGWNRIGGQEAADASGYGAGEALAKAILTQAGFLLSV